MRHREDAVRPVLVGRALVAVRDAADGRHAAADIEDLLLRDAPNAHAVGGEARAAVKEERRDAPEQLALPQPLEVVDEPVRPHPDDAGWLVVGALGGLYRFLERLDPRDVELVVRLHLQLARRR